MNLENLNPTDSLGPMDSEKGCFVRSLLFGDEGLVVQGDEERAG